jgi:uncharacterized protein (TIGR00251 family)
MLISAKVFPKAKKNEVVHLGQNLYKVYTVKAATQGKANQAVIELLANHFKTRPNKVFLKTGSKNREKVFEILD